MRVLPAGATPSLAAVRGSNFCDVAAVSDEGNGTLILLSALDNLCKGASGQAVQCANLMRGLPEELGCSTRRWFRNGGCAARWFDSPVTAALQISKPSPARMVPPIFRPPVRCPLA